MALEVIEYEDLFGNEINKDVLKKDFNKQTIDILQQLNKGTYTALLIVDYKNNTYPVFEMKYTLLIEHVIVAYRRLIFYEMGFSDLVIQSDKNSIQLIAPFKLQEQQRTGIYNLIAPMLELNFEHLKGN